MKTETKVIIDLYDTTAKTDGHYEANTQFQYGALALLDKKEYVTTKYATCEQDVFFLDGSFSIMDQPLNNEFCYWSGSVAKEDGTFDVEPTLVREFSKFHSSAGLTIMFDPNYDLPLEIEISIFNGDSILAKDTFYPDNYSYFADIESENYNKIQIVFKKVRKYGFARVLAIEYGVVLKYSSDSNRYVKKASLLEELNIASTELSVNTSKIEVIDEDKLFDITNPKGYYNLLQKRQMVEIYEVVNGVEYQMAVHYLKEWSTKNGVISTFECQDILGLMSDTQFKGGKWGNTQASIIVKEIMDDFGLPFESYYMDNRLYETRLWGVIKPCSHREALQQVAFACQCVVDTSRIDGINIYHTSTATQSTVSYDRIFMSPEYKITQGDLVTQVDVTVHDFQESSEVKQAYKGILNAGEYIITYNEPFSGVTVTGDGVEGTTDFGYFYNHIIVHNDNTEVVITGVGYTENTWVYSKKLTDDGGIGNKNVKKITNATLVSKTNVADVANFMADYYRLRLNHEFKIIMDQEKAGNYMAVRHNESFMGVLPTSVDIDLTGGYLAKIKGVGYALSVSNNIYAGNDELIAGDEVGVI